MAWTTPKTASIGEVYTAAWYNLHTRDNLGYLKSAIDSEVAARGGADTSEANARTAAINSEISARSLADMNLQDQIDELAGGPVASAARTGVVGASGGFDVGGAGMSASHGSTGRYTVSFSPAFGAVPIVACTAYGSARVVSINAISASSVDIWVKKQDQSDNDCAFSVIAFG